MRLDYQFSSVPPQGFPGRQATDLQGETVYVMLVHDEDGKHWRASQFGLQPPTTGKFLRGQINKWNRIEFGIESYFVQEGRGVEYENAASRGSLSAEVALDPSGKAVLKRLVVDKDF